MIKHLFLGVLFFCTACSPNYDWLIQSITEHYYKHSTEFDDLAEMLTEENKSDACITISADRMPPYNKNYFGDKWSSTENTKIQLTLVEVLNRFNLSKARYDEYIDKLEIIRSKGIRYCELERGQYISVDMYDNGFIFGGCNITIELTSDTPEPSGTREDGTFREITYLGSGWYLEFSCF